MQLYFCRQVAGFSIPATEHSTMTSWGRDGESAAVRYAHQLGQGWRISCRQVGPSAWAGMENQLPSGRPTSRGRDGESAAVR